MPVSEPPLARSADAPVPLPPRRATRARGAAACLLVATLGTVAIALPVLRDPSERLIGREIVGRKHDPYTVIAQFERPRMPTLRTQPATDYLGALVARGTGGVAAYNVVVLATFPLAALFAFLFARHLTGAPIAAWTAALFFAFSPFHLAHAAYHPHISQIQWLPLALLALWRAAERADGARLGFLLASLAVAALSNFYLGITLAALLPVALLAAWWSRDPDAGGGPAAPLARVAATLALLAAAAWVYARRFAPRVLDDARSLSWPREDLESYTARWWSYLVPPVDHPVLGGFARRTMDGAGVRGGLVEQQVTIGFGIGLLATAAFVLWLRDRRRAELRAVPGLVLLAAAAFACSLSPEWNVGGLRIPGPSALLYAIAPMFRAHARFALVVGLAAFVLAGLALHVAWRRGPRAAKLAAGALLALAVFELTPLPPWRWRDVLPTTAHRWLEEHRPPGKILDCVSARDIDQRSVPALFGPGLELLGPSQDCGEPGLAATLAARGVSTVIVRRETADGAALLARPMAPGFTPLRELEDAAIWTVTAPPAELYLELGGGFYKREYRDQGSFRWMNGEGELAIVNRTGAPARVGLEATLHAFPAPRRAVLSAPGSAPVAVEVGLAPETKTFAPIHVPPGRHRLRLSSADPPTVADEVLHNGDLRALSVAIWEWRIAPAEDAPALPPPVGLPGS